MRISVCRQTYGFRCVCDALHQLLFDGSVRTYIVTTAQTKCVDSCQIKHVPSRIRTNLCKESVHLTKEHRQNTYLLTQISCAPVAHCCSHSHVKNMLIAGVAHARHCSASTSAPFTEMLEGFNRMKRRKVHALMTRKRDIWPHQTPPTQLTHVTSHQSHRTTLQH